MGGRDVIGPAVALDPPRREGPSTPAKPSTLPRCAASTRALLSKADSCRDGAASLMACRVNWLMLRHSRISDSLVHIWKLAAQRFLRVARILWCWRWVVFVCSGSAAVLPVSQTRRMFLARPKRRAVRARDFAECQARAVNLFLELLWFENTLASNWAHIRAGKGWPLLIMIHGVGNRMKNSTIGRCERARLDVRMSRADRNIG